MVYCGLYDHEHISATCDLRQNKTTTLTAGTFVSIRFSAPVHLANVLNYVGYNSRDEI